MSTVRESAQRELTPGLIVPKINEEAPAPVECDELAFVVGKNMQARSRQLVDITYRAKNANKPHHFVLLSLG